MQTFKEAEVYLIAKPLIKWNEIENFFSNNMELGGKEAWTEFKQPMDDGAKLVEFCGRICYCSFGEKQGRKTTREYLSHIIESGHGSVLEHANYTFLFTDISRGVTHELIRHRAGFAFSQESTHFIDYSKNMKIHLPVEISEYWEQYVALGKTAQMLYEQTYNSLRALGMKKKEACAACRGMLPIAIESKICVTANIRSWRHFMEIRGAIDNVPEIRLLALKVFRKFKTEEPLVLIGMEIKKNENGDEYIWSQYKKV